MNPKELVAANIRAIRKRQGLTQAQAAARIDWEQPTWAEYESGKKSPGVEVLADIARALNTSMAELVSVTIVGEVRVAKKKQARRR